MPHSYKIDSPVPSLSLRERDRRWTKVREFLRARGLDALLIAGLESGEQPHQYLTNDHGGGYTVFPVNGELTFLAWTPSRVTAHLQAVGRGDVVWISDIRIGANAQGAVAVIREKSLEQASIGVVGLGGAGSRQGDGWIPYTAWSRITSELPAVRFQDVTEAYLDLMLPKSAEELAVIRRAALAGELAGQAMLEVISPGISEADIAAAVQSVLYRNAAAMENAYLIIHSGPDNPSWGPPLWLVRPSDPRVIRPGDVVQAELFPAYGSLRVQVQVCVAVPPIDPINEVLASTARESYERGLSALRAGVTFAEVANAMVGPLKEKGFWNLTPLIHSLSPNHAVGGRGLGMEQLPGIEAYLGMDGRPITSALPTGREDLVLQPGMVFELEPNACQGRHRINIGGTVVVTESGVEELNHLSTRMQVAKGPS